jgi:hypothetical protein
MRNLLSVISIFFNELIFGGFWPPKITIALVVLGARSSLLHGFLDVHDLFAVDE